MLNEFISGKAEMVDDDSLLPNIIFRKYIERKCGDVALVNTGTPTQPQWKQVVIKCFDNDCPVCNKKKTEGKL